MKIKRVIVLASIICLFFTACQPTPSNEPIRNKGSGAFEEALLVEMPDDSDYTVPSTWEELIELKNSNVNISASIEIPNESTHAVLTIEQRLFSADDLEMILNSLYPDVLGVREAGTSREDLLEDLYLIQRGIFVGYDENTGEPLYESYENKEEEIARIESELEQLTGDTQYENLSDDAYDLPCNRVFMDSENGKIYVRGSQKSLAITRDREIIIQPERWVLEGDAYPGEMPHTLENISIDETSALSEVENMLYDLGLEYLSPASVEKARILSQMNEVLSEGWMITCSRDDGFDMPIDLQTLSKNTVLDLTDACTYTLIWSPEQLTVFVDATGIRAFYWDYATRVSSVVNSNVQLLPFQNIQQIIRDTIKYGLSWTESSSNIADEVLITRIVLTYCTQKAKDQAVTEAYYAPVWIVFVTTDAEKQLGIAPGIIAISAIDGSIVSLV